MKFSPTSFYITSPLSLSGGKFSISKDEYEKISASRAKTLFGLGIEEKIDHVLNNYVDLEKTVLNMALEHSIFFNTTLTILSEGSHIINRHLANLLTTARMYLDQVDHELSNSYGDSSFIRSSFNNFRNSEYDSAFGYRLMEAIRNHTQHFSLPINAISLTHDREKHPNSDHFHFRVIPSISINSLEENKKFKRKILNELKSLTTTRKEGYLDAIPYIRQYVESLGNIHENLRMLTKSDLQSADTHISNVKTLSEQKIPDHSGIIIAIAYDEISNKEDVEYIDNETTTRRIYLENKNRSLKNLPLRYVSSKY